MKGILQVVFFCLHPRKPGVGMLALQDEALKLPSFKRHKLSRPVYQLSHRNLAWNRNAESLGLVKARLPLQARWYLLPRRGRCQSCRGRRGSALRLRCRKRQGLNWWQIWLHSRASDTRRDWCHRFGKFDAQCHAKVGLAPHVVHSEFCLLPLGKLHKASTHAPSMLQTCSGIHDLDGLDLPEAPKLPGHQLLCPLGSQRANIQICRLQVFSHARR
mmetsp:Transcript_97677/g.188380  ORF Transcript_97677/g.188380 Transcript_97677/m.188380 type:complete len:216 (-) Transcript_97677:272-919(-)